jgi:hypothetical protein
MRLRLAAGIAVALSLSVGVATALAAPKAGKWRGTNSQTPSYPLTFQVTKNRQGVLDFQPTFTVNCTKRNETPEKIKITTDTGTNIAIRGGTFKLRSDHARIHNGPALYAIGHETIAGTFFSKTSAAGSYSLNFTFNKSAPGGLAGFHCATGRVHWTASHT